jgi:hypothetical protein
LFVFRRHPGAKRRTPALALAVALAFARQNLVILE